jgi:hypothetical protein
MPRYATGRKPSRRCAEVAFREPRWDPRDEQPSGESVPCRGDCSQECSQATGRRPTHVDIPGIPAQPATGDGRSWTTCPLLRIGCSPEQARARCMPDRPVNDGNSRSLAGQPDTPAHLQSGRLTRCANRRAKQRIRLFVGRSRRIRSGCGRTLGFRRAGHHAPSLGKAGARPCPQPSPARRSPASSRHLSAEPPTACRPVGITMAPLAGLRAARRTLFCTARFDRSLAACCDRAS